MTMPDTYVPRVIRSVATLCVVIGILSIVAGLLGAAVIFPSFPQGRRTSVPMFWVWCISFAFAAPNLVPGVLCLCLARACRHKSVRALKATRIIAALQGLVLLNALVLGLVYVGIVLSVCVVAVLAPVLVLLLQTDRGLRSLRRPGSHQGAGFEPLVVVAPAWSIPAEPVEQFPNGLDKLWDDT